MINLQNVNLVLKEEMNMLKSEVKNDLGNWLVGIHKTGEVVIRLNHPPGPRPEWCTSSVSMALIASPEDYQKLGEMFLEAVRQADSK
jgi:hypothetical protein